MIAKTQINVELGYAHPDDQVLMTLSLDDGDTVEDAIRQSGILERFVEIDLTCNKVGIFGKQCTLSRVLRGGDRIEIYRPLLVDPKVARRRRAERSSANSSSE